MAERIQSFESRLERALDRVRIILETTRSPQYANDVPHTYDDKYFLAEYLTNCGLAAQSCVLNLLGVDSANLATLRGWAKNRTVSLQLSSEQVCKFVKKTTRQVESDTEHVTTTKILGITAATTSSKVVSTVDEWFWDLTATYRISAFPGTEASGGALLRKGEGTHQLCTLSERTPHPEIVSFPAIQVNITWLLQQIDDQGAFQFSIDRSVDSCRTPRRNTDVQRALDFFSSLASWFSRVNDFFRSNQFSRQEQASLQMSAINGADLFVPILPLFEEEAPRTDDDDASSSTASSSSSDAASSSSSSSSSFLVPVGKSTIKGDVVLPVGDVSRFLAEQRRSIEERFAEFSRLFPRDGKLITELEAQICALAQHGSSIASVYSGAVDYIEQMLYKQLNSAIGKEVSPTDFADYMRFHNRKLFRERYEPRPFCHAVRRPDHYPEGVISIEATTSGLPEPILTSVRAVEPVHPMTFALDAATNVTFRGERFLHSWINHSFSGASGLSLALTARARQFSSFILLVGRVASATVFEPTGAIIIQNKDDLKIPLLLEQIPTPKEFQDAIDSLSPEQQRFARAYRDMQLQSTLFAVCVIQIKPQLEKLLRLPDDALTKEIRLTQDLLELFIKYQIPSDLLSYDGGEDASLASKLDTVRDYVAGLRKMIDEKKDDELTDAAQNALFGALDPTVSPRSVSQPIGGGGGGGIWVPDGSGSSRGGSFVHALSSRTSRSRSGVVAGDQSVAASSRVKPERPVEQPKQLDGDSSVFDFTAIPQRLDRQFAALDIDSALRPTIIKAEKSWTRTRQPTLLSSPSTATLTKQQRKTEKSQAFDLLDALSRSGSLPFDDVSFHVVLAATHCFTKSVTDTVIVDNVNPIEKVERSILIVSQTVHERPAAELVNESQLSRVQQASPILFSSST